MLFFVHNIAIHYCVCCFPISGSSHTISFLVCLCLFLHRVLFLLVVVIFLHPRLFFPHCTLQFAHCDAERARACAALSESESAYGHKVERLMGINSGLQADQLKNDEHIRGLRSQLDASRSKCDSLGACYQLFYVVFA